VHNFVFHKLSNLIFTCLLEYQRKHFRQRFLRLTVCVFSVSVSQCVLRILLRQVAKKVGEEKGRRGTDLSEQLVVCNALTEKWGMLTVP